MKKIFAFITCIISLAILGVTSYEALATGCQKGVSFFLEPIPSEFGLDRDVAAEVIEQAADVWNEKLGQEVIEFKPNGDRPITFIYDERQAETQFRKQDEIVIATSRAEVDQLVEDLNQMKAQRQNEESLYQANRRAYQSSQTQYNNRVEAANNGQPVDRSALEEERRSLQAEYQQLESQRQSLNSLVADINRLTNEVNAKVASLNDSVRDFNQNYAGDDTFRQGVYGADGIEIYQYENAGDLLAVLVHEFGHALGIGHVEDSQAVMYYLQHDSQASRVTLTDDDITALVEVCETSVYSIERLKTWLGEIRAI